MKILFLPNWEVNFLEIDSDQYQPANKYVIKQPYWFFKYFPSTVEVDIIDIKGSYYFLSIEKILKVYLRQNIKGFFNERKYDLIISHGAQSGIFNCFLNRIFGRHIPHFIIDVGCMNGARSNIFEISLLRFALSSKPHVIYHSLIQYSYYKKYFNFLLEKTKYIPFGVDTDFFSPNKNISQGDYILSFGYAKRDYNTLIAAWKKLNINAKLKIIGARIKNKISNVEFRPTISIEKLKNEISGSKFIVIPLPYLNYSYSQMSLLQSMSMAKTVIITKTPSTVDYICDGKGAYFVSPYDSDDLKTKIEYLFGNQVDLEQSNITARNLVIEKFNEKKMAERIYKFIVDSNAIF